MRLFVAVELDGGAKREIEKLLKKLQKKHWSVRWESVEKLHMTLAFLGEVGKIRGIREIGEILKETARGVSSFVISFKGLGCFPNYVFPGVIWLGLKGDLKSLAALQKDLRQKLEAAGFTFNKRPFMPHLTLGRIKKDCHRAQRQEIGRQLMAMRELEFRNKWHVDRVTFYQSQLRHTGSVYLKLAEIRLV